MIYSKQREAVQNALRGMHGLHPSADMLYASLKTQYPNISLATVYRNLNQLADAGLIARIVMPDGANRFDDIADGHLHMLCTQCGEIADVPGAALGDLYKRAEACSGHDVNSCRLLFFGVCCACKRAS